MKAFIVYKLKGYLFEKDCSKCHRELEYEEYKIKQKISRSKLKNIPIEIVCTYCGHVNHKTCKEDIDMI